jgi:glyceraldehyde-3-phosphate dehydrogenase (NADP+)
MAPVIAKPEVPSAAKAPYVDGAKVLVDGDVRPWTGACTDVLSPMFAADGSRIVIGRQAVFTPAESMAAIDSASRSWAKGRGVWATMTFEQRIAAVEGLVERLKNRRAHIVEILQWEICKNDADAAKEFDRTMEFIQSSIDYLRLGESNDVVCDGGIHAKLRRSPVGVMMNLGPMNYPFNETYATLIPALLCGNSVVMKIPNIGGLAHVLTMEAYAESFPKGVVNFVAGRGRDTMPPIMQTGKVDLFAFIGSSKAADSLIRQHPQPHRLRNLLSLDGKNLGIVLPDADLSIAVKECLAGSTSFNGQRCTAIKLIVVHKSIAAEFTKKFSEAVNSLSAGSPFGKNAITPLPEPDKPQYLQELVDDAKAGGASIINERGGETDRTLVFPSVLYPVTKSMRAYHEEQFGPLIPIADYDDVEEVLEHLADVKFGQQVAIFTKSAGEGSPQLAKVLDACALTTCRVNINAQCQRGPDTFPFAGRKSSALGTISVTEVLRAVSVETLVAAKTQSEIDGITRGSRVFAPVRKA